MSNRPYSNDWESYSDNVDYSPRLGLYWSNGTIYDELSASHNGIIGMGAQLKQVIKEHNEI